MANRRIIYTGFGFCAALGLFASAAAQLPNPERSTASATRTSQSFYMNVQAPPMILTPFALPTHEHRMDEWLRQQGCIDLFVRTSLPAKCRGANGEWISLGMTLTPPTIPPSVTPIP